MLSAAALPVLFPLPGGSSSVGARSLKLSSKMLPTPYVEGLSLLHGLEASNVLHAWLAFVCGPNNDGGTDVLRRKAGVSLQDRLILSITAVIFDEQKVSRGVHAGVFVGVYFRAAYLQVSTQCPSIANARSSHAPRSPSSRL